MSLLFALFFCHWIGDYTHLSRPHMLAAKRLGKPFLPILDHAAVHGSMMYLVLLGFGVGDGPACTLALLQVISHAAIDWLKGRLNGWFPALQNPANKAHWYVFGLDQLAHTAVILLMWYAAVKPHIVV